MNYTNKKPGPEEYNNLRILSGMGDPKSLDRIQVALDNSLYIVSVYEENELIALGRIVGDRGITYAITDIMVSKQYQGKGVGHEIMNRIDAWLDENTDDRSFVMLFARRPADRLYQKHRFNALNPDERVGMRRQ